MWRVDPTRFFSGGERPGDTPGHPPSGPFGPVRIDSISPSFMDATIRVVPRDPVEGDIRMHVYGPAHLHGAQSVGSPHAAQLNRPASAPSSGPIQDEVQISDAVLLLDQVNDLPAIRQDKVNQIRQQIANGTYETPEKMQVAVERLLGEIG